MSHRHPTDGPRRATGAALQRHRAALTPDPVPLVAVSRSGTDCAGLDAAYGSAELLAAWRS
ncbi:hypothetical protein ACFV2X_36220 [Streptomyces sp. NPDC059679]|uniref:hypothetical protein n=1 Tax=Streptomyces sp. NPDC059679 TaxID=3346903 RepID=UPI0036847813